MKNVKQIYLLYASLFFMAFSFNSCSDDDDAIEMQPTGIFEVNDDYTLSGNTVTLETVTVGQDSWLVAVNPGDESTNNFISDPVMLEQGTNTNVQLTLDEGAISDDGTGQEIVLKLYADNPNSGTPGEWDPADQPIRDENNMLLTETITVFAETPQFSDFDTNNDGFLDSAELPNLYQNSFDDWDVDDDNLLSLDEFNTTTFSLTDIDDDDGINQDEWNEGFSSFFGNWNDDDFGTFDADSNGMLSSDEWTDAFAESEWFGTFDADDDDMLAEDEWDAGLFGDWDTNDDDRIDEDEFNVFAPWTQNW